MNNIPTTQNELFKDAKGEVYEFLGMAGNSVVGKKQNGKCAYTFQVKDSGLTKGLRIPQGFFQV